MFAVPGWNVSADKLKPEVAPAEPNESSTPSKPKKRKRPSQIEEVTAANLTDLWEKVIEHKRPGSVAGEKLSRKDRKRQKRERDSEQGKPKPVEAGGGGDQEKDAQSKSQPSPGEGEGISETQPKKQDKKGKKEKRGKEKGEQGQKVKDKQKNKRQQDQAESSSRVEEEAAAAATRPTAPAPAPTPAAPPKLTPLQASMRDKLVSARFRHLNETLYTRPSAEAYELFRDAPDMFQQYHEGFRRQVAVWPENPIDGYIADIQRRGKVKPVAPPPRGGGRERAVAPQQQQQQQRHLLPLPRTSGTCTIADLGCGDARLAAALEKGGAKRKLRVEVLSYDLHGDEAAGVTRADMANLPLADGAVDVAVFCLALMGTNWLDFIDEAYRVLRWKGELWVAEIKSRFAPSRRRAAAAAVVEHSVGHRRKQPGKKKDEEGAGEADLAVEVDGADDRRGETDVSAFVEALRKRGFLLLGEGSDAVDLRNKMFVKMRFAKAAAAVREKAAAASGARMHDGGLKKKKFIEAAAAAADGADDEASILKPCVYKLR